ncbi:MAG: helix-turn-helix domain-containing protein [Xanthobacteraceae bacterium]
MTLRDNQPQTNFLRPKSNAAIINMPRRHLAILIVAKLSSRLSRYMQTQDRLHSKASTIDLTQDFLSQMLGTRRTTVTLVARALQAAGLIQYRRGKIEILDRPGLEEAACECYKIIRHETLPKIIGIDLKTR